jgi:hypothetical protein
MSYYVYDENGYVGDFATTKGLDDFMKWCETIEDIEVREFAENASHIHPEALHESFEVYDPPEGDIKKTYDNFLSILPKCKGIVIVSDGVNEDLPEEE